MITMETPGLLDNLLGRGVVPQADCLIWPGAVDRGYGRTFVDGQAKRVHRVVWELQNGAIPDDLTIDHLCRVRSCMNVAHMELVTHSENARRAASIERVPRLSKPAPRRRVTECKRGHGLVGENVMTDRRGHRKCRLCARNYDAARRERDRAAP